jgi:hypothetical protein
MGILSHRVTCVYYQTHTKSQSQLCTHKWDKVYYYQTFLLGPAHTVTHAQPTIPASDFCSDSESRSVSHHT